MRVYRSLEEIPTHPLGSCVALGVFDGVHLGHREVLSRAVRWGRQNHWRSVALTFDPHPQQVIAGTPEPFLILPLGERLRRISTLGLEAAVVLRFDDRLRRTEPEEFVRRVLVEGLGAKAVVCGPDFRFGRDRRGDPELLDSLGKQLGFAVEVCPPVVVDGERVSSSRIRSLLREGRPAEACELLAHPEVVACVVREGKVLAVHRAGGLELPKTPVLSGEEPEHAAWRVLEEVAEFQRAGAELHLLTRTPVPETLEVWSVYTLGANPVRAKSVGIWVDPRNGALEGPYRRVGELALGREGS